MEIPAYALSVRQPWAWAICVGIKDVENRGRLAVTKGRMKHHSRIAIHAATGMTQKEYERACEFIGELGYNCPAPNRLIRGAIVGAATIGEIKTSSSSPWWMGKPNWAIHLSDAVSLGDKVIPAKGQLGIFQWSKSKDGFCEPKPWMIKLGKLIEDNQRELDILKRPQPSQTNREGVRTALSPPHP